MGVKDATKAAHGRVGIYLLIGYVTRTIKIEFEEV